MGHQTDRKKEIFSVKFDERSRKMKEISLIFNKLMNIFRRYTDILYKNCDSFHIHFIKYE